ncbi:MAG: DUF2799 domain-containing protein [Rhodobacteraceae bacterium]|nr:DUF2799 domain-containing protein [Paracoccaceae bacterium]
MRIYTAGAFFVFLGACASLTQEQCLNGDWGSIGYNDGINGQQESYISRHFEACEKVGIVPDTRAWLEGRAQGLPLYCTPQNAYSVGRGGDDLSPVCPSSQQNTLYRAWDWGQEYYIITREVSELEREERDIKRRISSDFLLDPLTPEQILELAHLNQRLRRIDREIYRLEERRRRYASAPI